MNKLYGIKYTKKALKSLEGQKELKPNLCIHCFIICCHGNPLCNNVRICFEYRYIKGGGQKVF